MSPSPALSSPSPHCIIEQEEVDAEGNPIPSPREAAGVSPRGAAAGGSTSAAAGGGSLVGANGGGAGKRPKLGKDPTVATDFLPDADREQAEEALRNKLKKVKKCGVVSSCRIRRRRCASN